MTHQELFSKLETFTDKMFQDLTKAYSIPTKYKSFADMHKDIISAITYLYDGVPFQEATYLARNKLIDAPKCQGCELPAAFKTAPVKHYSKFCCQLCQRQHRNSQEMSVTINDTLYRSINDASDALGISRSLIRHRVISPKFNEWKYAVDHDKQCYEYICGIDSRFATNEFLLDWKRSGKSQQQLAESIGKHAETVRYALWYYDLI